MYTRSPENATTAERRRQGQHTALNAGYQQPPSLKNVHRLFSIYSTFAAGQENKKQCTELNSTVTTAASCPLNGVENAARPVLHEVWDIADSVAMGYEIPTPGAVAVVVEPGTENEVCCGSEEYAGVSKLANKTKSTRCIDSASPYIRTIHVKKPQWLLPSLSSSSSSLSPPSLSSRFFSQACFVYHVRWRISASCFSLRP